MASGKVRILDERSQMLHRLEMTAGGRNDGGRVGLDVSAAVGASDGTSHPQSIVAAAMATSQSSGVNIPSCPRISRSLQVAFSSTPGITSGSVTAEPGSAQMLHTKLLGAMDTDGSCGTTAGQVSDSGGTVSVYNNNKSAMHY